MSDSDEPDYMSDAFLNQCVAQDVRPGLKRVSKHSTEKLDNIKKIMSLQRERLIFEKRYLAKHNLLGLKLCLRLYATRKNF